MFYYRYYYWFSRLSHNLMAYERSNIKLMISGMNTYNSPAMFVGSRNDLVIYTFHMLD